MEKKCVACSKPAVTGKRFCVKHCQELTLQEKLMAIHLTKDLRGEK